MQRGQQRLIDYLVEENRILEAKHGRRRSGSPTKSALGSHERGRPSAASCSTSTQPSPLPTPSCDGTESSLLIDRDTKFTENFRRVPHDSAIEIVRTPARCPQANGVAERFVGTVRREVLSRMIFFGIASLTHALREFVDQHDLRGRNHQGIDNELIESEPGVGSAVGQIQRRNRLGGLLRYYHRSAA